jgi:mono/diheme cytochrome c family protein
MARELNGSGNVIRIIEDQNPIMKSALFGSLLCLGLSGIPTFAAEDTAQIKQLTVEDAKRVGTGGRGALNLDGVTTLSDAAAKELEAASRRELFLNSLTTLSPAAARSICKAELDLHLNGLKTISDEALKAMSEHRAHPDLGRPFVHFKGLTTISDDGAAILATWLKWSGELPALTALSEKAAASLAGSRNWDGRLPAMATLPAETARGLAQWNGSLSLDGLTTLTDAVAVALAPHRGGTLSFNGLKTLSDGAAAALAGREGRLSLNGFTTLSSGTAKALAAHKGDWLFLDGLTTLTDDAAKSLAQHRGVVSLLGLTTLTADALRTLKANPRIDYSEKFRTAAVAGKPVAADAKLLRSFLDSHCANCHDQGEKEGDFALDRLAQDNVAGRVAYASILERLRAGDMPPAKKPRPDAAEAAAVMKWIQAKLDTPLPGKPAYFVVKEKPIDGNRLPNAILFGGPRGPSVPPPPRLWRISPDAYNSWLGEFKAGGQQPFGIIQDAGFKDFSALYSPDEGASGLLLSNAEQLVGGQASAHKLVNVNETPSTIKGPVWPDEARAKTATPKEQEALKAGIRVSSGKSVFAPLLHPQVRANPEELARALQSQFMVAVARPPDAKEIESLLALYNKIAAFGDCSIAGKTVLMAPLMIPEAILRFEVGLGAEVRPGVRMLSPRETAFALSLAFSPKRDPGLLTAAAQGKLTTREEVAENVRQILANPKIGKSRIVLFFREYFDYYRAPDVFKDPFPSYQQRRGDGYDPRRMVGETDALVMAILARDKDVLKDLLTTNESYATGPDGHLDRLASGEALFQPFGPVALKTRYESQGGRIGIPMQRSWHVAWSTNFHNDIVRRGRWVRERLLGGRVPDLPINAAAMVPDDPHHTLRQRQMVTREANCWKCHNKMDELGLPFEDFDHYARPRRGEEILDLAAMERLKEQAKDKKAKDQVPKLYREAPLDTTGTIANSGDPTVDGPVKDAPQMLRRLAESERVRQIFIRHVFRYFMGRNETPGDAVTLQEAEKAYLESGGSFKALLVSLLSSESFLYRTVPVAASKS